MEQASNAQWLGVKDASSAQATLHIPAALLNLISNTASIPGGVGPHWPSIRLLAGDNQVLWTMWCQPWSLPGEVTAAFFQNCGENKSFFTTKLNPTNFRDFTLAEAVTFRLARNGAICKRSFIDSFFHWKVLWVYFFFHLFTLNSSEVFDSEKLVSKLTIAFWNSEYSFWLLYTFIIYLPCLFYFITCQTGRCLLQKALFFTEDNKMFWSVFSRYHYFRKQ